MVNRTQAPEIRDAVTFDFYLQPCNKTLCDNSIPIYWLNAGSQEVVQVDWVFNAGLWQESAVSVAQAVAALLKNGTDTHTSLQLNEAIEFYGASLKVVVNNDYAFVTLYTLTRHLPSLLPVIREIIINASFPEEELMVYKQNALQRLSVNLRQCDFVANRHIDAFLFGKEHPYGRYSEAPDIEMLNADIIRRFHQETYTSANCRIFMSGNITAADVQLVQDFFGKDVWNGSAAFNQPAILKAPMAEKKHRIMNDKEGVQGAVRIAREFVTRQHPDFAPMIVLNTLFGGYFGSRLMANIREEKGFTYGIYSHLYNFKHDGALLIATEAGRDVCEQTIEEVYKEMRVLREEPVDNEELLLVKNYLLGSLLGDLDGPFSIMQRWKNLILNDMGEEDFHRNIGIYKSITPVRVQELANQYLRQEDFYELLVI